MSWIGVGLHTLTIEVTYGSSATLHSTVAVLAARRRTGVRVVVSRIVVVACIVRFARVVVVACIVYIPRVVVARCVGVTVAAGAGKTCCARLRCSTPGELTLLTTARTPKEQGKQKRQWNV